MTEEHGGAAISSSRFDRDATADARDEDEGRVRALYEEAPYPDLGADLKDLSRFWSALPELTGRADLRFLEAGCGTGHNLVGVAKRFPGWRCHGLDLSDASLAVAAQLAERHGARVTLHRGSYLDPSPFDAPFDVIAAIGTIHHAADPVAALRNLVEWLRPGGTMLLHLYGWRCDSRKFDIKEMLSMFEPDLFAHQRRFELYDALMRHRERRRPWWKRLLLSSPYDGYVALRRGLARLSRRARRQSESPPFTDRYTSLTAPWIDHFCHPCERAYEVPHVRALVEAVGLEPVALVTHGRPRGELVPPEWRDAHDALDFWEKARLSELLAEGGGSFNLIARKPA